MSAKTVKIALASNTKFSVEKEVTSRNNSNKVLISNVFSSCSRHSHIITNGVLAAATIFRKKQTDFRIKRDEQTNSQGVMLLFTIIKPILRLLARFANLEFEKLTYSRYHRSESLNWLRPIPRRALSVSSFVIRWHGRSAERFVILENDRDAIRVPAVAVVSDSDNPV